MKILMVNKFLYPRGGAETYVLKIGECLQKQGHDVQYFGMHDSRNTVGNALRLETYHMDFHSAGPGRFLYPFRILYSREAKKKIRAVADRFRPDIVHLNNINFQLTPSVILRGDMSLVGTRPPTVDEWEQYDLHHRARLSFRPGLTGLWQISGRSSITDFEEVVRLDTKYIDEWTLGLDIKILLKTIGVVLRGQGAM